MEIRLGRTVDGQNPAPVDSANISDSIHAVLPSQVVRWSDKLFVNSRGSNRVGLWSKALVYYARVQIHCPAECRAEWSDELHTVMQPTSGIDSRCTSKRTDGVCLLPTSMQLPENH